MTENQADRKSVNNAVNWALTESEIFYDKFNIGSKLKLSEYEAEIFKTYFSAYVLRKSHSCLKIHQLTRDPRADVAFKIPIFRGIITWLFKEDQSHEEAAKKLMETAQSYAKFLINPTPEAIELIEQTIEEEMKRMEKIERILNSEHVITIRKENKDITDQDILELREKIEPVMSSEGATKEKLMANIVEHLRDKPAALQRHANMLTTFYFQEEMSKEVRQKNVQEYLERIISS
ncbi:MAG: hypothetical protein V1808_03345 [Candidatus Daviesbacteria bacterium]